MRTLWLCGLLLSACPTEVPIDGGDGEGELVAEGEGELAEGEGEPVAEGEGELAEGEGELAEGEGEFAGEGEGELAEGEGEFAGEGEGEPTEGEGEPPPAAMSVLMIGNSQLGVSRPQPPDLPLALEQLSDQFADGATVMVVDAAQINGNGCSGFWNAGTGFGTPRERAGSGQYDIVILVPAIFEGTANEPCWEDFRDVAEQAGSRFAMMATGHVSGSYPAGFIGLDTAIGNYAAAQSLLFIPAGDAWLRVLGDAPGNSRFEFYAGDDAHPGVEATYLYTLATYGALTGRSVVGAPLDLLGLRCPPSGDCLSYDELAACIEPDGQNGCSQPQPGELFDGNGRPSIITADEASVYQAAVDAALAAR
jgi:hypothetical protein